MPALPRHSRPPAPGRGPVRSRTHSGPPAAAPAALPANGAGRTGAEGRELEWQLTAPDLGVVRRWIEQHGRLDDLSIAPLPTQQLHDTYLDTEDWRVMRAGFALRLREKGSHAEATLKGLRSARSDAADRREITEPLAAGRAKALARASGPVGSRVHDVAGVKPLRTLFDVRTTRQRFVVRTRGRAGDIGEIALDEARFSRGNGHRRPMVLTRVELEATGPDSAPLERLAERLCAECGLHRATENKFAVGLRSASLEPPRDARPDREAEQPPAPMMDPRTRAGDFAIGALRRLLREWQINEPAARLGEAPEPLHRLRVTGRRMDTVLNLFRGCLPASLAKSRPMLKGLIDALGGVRDVDIRLQAVATFRNGLPEGDRPALDPLLRHLESERARARAAMLRALDAKPARDWLDALPEQLARAAAATAPESSRNTAALIAVPRLIRKRYRELRKCARRLTPESPIGEFHEVRIRTKKLRYALEVVAPTYAGSAEEMLERLHKLQSKLGTQHDADVIARYLEQLATRPPADFTPATLFMMGRMAQLNTVAAARMGGKIERPWSKVRGRRWKALRARMQKLRKRTRRYERKISAAHHGAGGNKGFFSPVDRAKLTGSGGNARSPGVHGSRRAPGASGLWAYYSPTRH